MEIGKRLPPIAVSALLTKKVKLSLIQGGATDLADSIVHAYERDTIVNIVVSDALARSELRMHGETLLSVAAELF